jgi:hypothetical protein
MSASDGDVIHTITDWHDGARRGVADFRGEPHYYESRWDEAADDWSEVYSLSPIDRETFRLAMEGWRIWLRWKAAFDEGRTTPETHPALPEDRARRDEIDAVLAERLVTNPAHHIKATAEFEYGPTGSRVRWKPVV